MKRFAIVHKLDDVSQKMARIVKKQVGAFMEYDETNPELVISVGGDGTILFAVHKYLDQLENVMFVGIHTGTLGFLLIIIVMKSMI